MERKLDIFILQGPAAPKQYVFREREITVGRGHEATLSLSEDPRISRQHLVLRVRSRGRFEAIDQSRAGTYCNGERLARAILPYGTQLKLGHTVLQVGSPPGTVPSQGPSPSRPLPSRALLLAGGTGLGVILLVLLLAAGRRPSSPPRAPRPESPRALMERGELKQAIEAFRDRQEPGPEEALLYRQAWAWSQRFEKAQQYEGRMQWKAAQDEWRLLAEELPENWAGLREWIQTGHVARLNQRLAGAGDG